MYSKWKTKRVLAQSTVKSTDGSAKSKELIPILLSVCTLTIAKEGIAMCTL